MDLFKPILQLLTKGLDLKVNDNVFLLYDRDFEKLASEIKEVSKKVGIKYRKKTFTSHNVKEIRIGDLINQIRRPSTPQAIILLCNTQTESIKFRLNLLKSLTNENVNWKIASMPGITFDVFKSLDFDLTKVHNLCEQLFLALNFGDQIRIETNNPKGEIDILHFTISNRTPIISSGVINYNSWGNYPSGETFVMPEIGSAEGWITIRGSIRNRPLGQEEWIRLKLSCGEINLNYLEASSQELMDQFKSLFKRDIAEYHTNCFRLCEFGIGANKGILELTGLSILDEKKYGTFHLGFGKNTQFGGDIECEIHHDLVVAGDSKIFVTFNKLNQSVLLLSKESINFIDYYKLVRESQLENINSKLFFRYNSFDLNNKLYLNLNDLRGTNIKIPLEIPTDVFKVLESTTSDYNKLMSVSFYDLHIEEKYEQDLKNFFLFIDCLYE